MKAGIKAEHRHTRNEDVNFSHDFTIFLLFIHTFIPSSSVDALSCTGRNTHWWRCQSISKHHEHTHPHSHPHVGPLDSIDNPPIIMVLAEVRKPKNPNDWVLKNNNVLLHLIIIMSYVQMFAFRFNVPQSWSKHYLL